MTSPASLEENNKKVKKVRCVTALDEPASSPQNINIQNRRLSSILKRPKSIIS